MNVNAMANQQQYVDARALGEGLVWIVVVTRPFQERRAVCELEGRFVLTEPGRTLGYEVYCPWKLTEKKQNGRVVTVPTPFFPRYLFARVDLQVNGWKKIYSSLGVAGVLGTSERPIAVADSVIARVRAQEDGGFIRMGLEAGHKQGDRIAIEDMGLEGVFVERVDEKRAVILVRLLGSDRRLTVDLGRIRSSQAG